MVNSSVSMEKYLERIPLYDVNNSVLSNELAVYSFLIDELNAEIEKMLCESFIDTASSYGLENKELLISDVRDDLTIEQRRAMLKLRENIDSSSFTVSKIKEACDSFALCKCKFTEYPSLYTVAIEIVGNYKDAQISLIKQQIKKIIPAHLNLSISFNGYPWSYNDLKNNRFLYIDNLDYTWEKIDNLL